MRTTFLLLCALCLPFVTVAAPIEEEPEIVIEITGDPDPVTDGVSVWNKSAKELEKIFKGKTRQEILYTADTVSSMDTTLKSTNGKKYRYVRYGQDDMEYRKFLFDDKDILLACADNISQVLLINRKYNINMGANESDFLRAFPEAILTNLIDFTSSQELQAYQTALPEEKGTFYFIFNNERLEQSFANDKEYADYVSQLTLRNQRWLEEEHEKKQKQLEELRQEQEKAIREARAEKYRWKALVEGGTTEDQLHLPRVRHPEEYTLPPLVPTKTRNAKKDFLH